MNIILFAVISYVFGNLNPAIIITKIKKGIDIRTVNSQNAGATNVTITLGFKYGIMIALLDIFKGVIPVLIVRLVYPENDAVWFLMGLMVMIGHIFPIFYQFKGGKGTATLVGVLVTATPVFGILLFILSVVLLLTTKYIAIPSILAAVITPIYLYFSSYSNEAIWIMLIFMVISLYKHRMNIVNIVTGRETSLNDISDKQK